MRRALPALAGAVLLLAGCGGGGSTATGASAATTTASTPGASEPAECRPVAGDSIVVLEDDQQVWPAQNVIPAVHAFSAEPALLAALDAASAALDTATLAGLNRAVDIEGAAPEAVGAAYVEDARIPVTDTSGSGPVVIGSSGTSESVVLAHVYAGALAKAGYAPEVRVVGGRETALPALTSGEITVLPEYTSDLATYLQSGAASPGPTGTPTVDEPTEAVVENPAEALPGLAEPIGIVFGEASPARRDLAVAVTNTFASEHAVATLSELAAACGGGVVLGGPPELADREVELPGLEEAYGLSVSRYTSLDDGGPLTKSALMSGQVTLGLVYTTDAALAPAADG